MANPQRPRKATWGEGDDTGTNITERSWSFDSPAGSSGTFYFGGYYIFGATSNDFDPAINLGSANVSYAAHVFIVNGAIHQTGADQTITISGTSITDAGVRTASDTEVITVPWADPGGTYYETDKKWIGQVSISKSGSGPTLGWNFGFCKYWDNNNTDFTIIGIEATWVAGANDSTPDIRVRHHKATGWTFNAAAPPTPPTAPYSMVADHVTEIKTVNGSPGAWKRTGLSLDIKGAGSEGTIIEIVTTANKTFELGNIILTIES